MSHKPCENCEQSPRNGARCDTHYCCSAYIEWQVERIWYEREADPQEQRRGVHFHDDDREV